jgi:branched-chain amino acid transport system permease protein
LGNDPSSTGNTAVEFRPRKTLYAVAIGAALLIALPLIAKVLPVSIPLFSEILVFGLFALSFNLALGYTGVISFGHAAFFGVGAYVTAICLKFFQLPLEASMLLGALSATAAGVIIAFLALQSSGAYQAVITLSMSMVFYYIAHMWISVTGGHDGMTGIPVLKLSVGIPLTGASVSKYYFILAIFLLCVFLQWRIVNSPFGKVMEAARENDQRAQTCGFNTYWVKWSAFVLSAFFSGVAGTLLLVFLEFCDVYILYWMTSGTVLVITLFGGAGTFLGPFIGALAFLAMKDSLSRYIEHWEVFTGFFFVALVLFLPKGIMGSLLAALAPKPNESPIEGASNLPDVESKP